MVGEKVVMEYFKESVVIYFLYRSIILSGYLSFQGILQRELYIKNSNLSLKYFNFYQVKIEFAIFIFLYL